jgi:hypothetical protein
MTGIHPCGNRRFGFWLTQPTDAAVADANAGTENLHFTKAT